MLVFIKKFHHKCLHGLKYLAGTHLFIFFPLYNLVQAKISKLRSSLTQFMKKVIDISYITLFYSLDTFKRIVHRNFFEKCTLFNYVRKQNKIL